MLDDTTVVDGDDYFEQAEEAVEPEANGDATPVGDVDSEAVDLEGDEPAVVEDEAVEDEYEPQDGEYADDALDPEANDEWLPGFEGRFRPGEEAKALEAYRNLESEFSRRQNEFREQLEREREAAFEQAAKLMQAQQPQRSVVQKIQEQQQLVALSYSNPGEAFRAALETGDDATIDAVIQAVATGDPELGIEGDYASSLQMQGVVHQMRSQLQQQTLAQQVQELKAQAVIQPAAESFRSKYADLLADEQIADVFRATVEANWNTLTDAADINQVNQVLERSLQQAVGHVALTHQQFVAPDYPQQATPTGEPQQRPAKRRPPVTGAAATRSAAPAEKKNEAEEYGDDILAAARQLRPAY